MLENTGERIIPDLMKISNGLLLEHVARYQFSLYYLKGRVLDIACGTGYGSQIIAKALKKEVQEVIGVDVDLGTIQYARSRYYHPKVHYLLGDATDPLLPGQLGTFDAIVSFETLEHLEEEQSYLQNLYSMLNPGGHLIVSTPFGRGRGQETNEPFHIHQLTEEEFKEMICSFPFKKCEFYNQRGVLVEPPRVGKHYPFGIAVCEK